MTPARSAAITILLLLAFGLLAACGSTPGQSPSPCPQPRATLAAPEPFQALASPLAPADYDRERARRIYETNDGGGCMACHGKKGDGRGPLASRLSLPPRNFSCAATMKAVSDGQMFWIVRHGSPGTPMLSHGELSDEETWQVVAYIRELGRQGR